MASVFTKIINGELPCYKIYEDEHVFAFLAREQINLGHTLVVPKKEIDHFIDVPEPYYTAVFQAAQRIGKAIFKVVDCKRVGASILGFDVPHFHYHLIPLNVPSDIDHGKGRIRSPEDMKLIQEKIIAQLDAM